LSGKAPVSSRQPGPLHEAYGSWVRVMSQYRDTYLLHGSGEPWLLTLSYQYFCTFVQHFSPTKSFEATHNGLDAISGGS
jgi:hypothetical protein